MPANGRRERERWNIFSVSLDRHNAGDLSTLHHTRQSVGTRPLMIAMCVCVRFILHSTADIVHSFSRICIAYVICADLIKDKIEFMRSTSQQTSLSFVICIYYGSGSSQINTRSLWLLSFIVADFSLLARELSALPTLIVSQRVSLWVCHSVVLSFCLSVCPHTSSAVLVRINWYNV